MSLDNISGKYLSGQCCGSLKNTTEYHGVFPDVRHYSNIPDIPLNPYKTPVDIAKKLIHEYGYSSQEVADFWDVSDICGI